MIVLIVTIEVNAVDIVTACTVHGVVATIIRAIGVGQREYEEVYII